MSDFALANRLARSWWWRTQKKVAVYRRFPELNIPWSCSWSYDDLGELDFGQKVAFGPSTEFMIMGPNEYSAIGGKLIVGSYSWIGSQSNVRAAGGIITIGEHCMLAHRTSLIASNHTVKKDSIYMHLPWDEQRHGITIGNNVWLGCGVTVLPGVNIGSNAVIGAGSVVTRDVPENTIWAGIPARHIRTIE